MSKFVIECPVCGKHTTAKDGFFGKKKIPCACGNIIDVRTDKLTSRHCPSCGNDVVFDQSKSKGKDAKCVVCHAPLLTDESKHIMLSFRCPTCACSLEAHKGASTYTCPVCDTLIDVQKELKIAEQQRNGMPSVIQFEGDNHTLVWKHPLNDFVMGTQLIVHESQEAIFFRNGEALDTFPAGRYTLETALLPKAEKLYKLPTDGQPFHAEIYFVNLTTLMNIKWGTNSKVGLFDPISGIHVDLGASGAFNLRIQDSRRLLMRLVGTTDSLTQQQLFGGESGYFKTLVMTRVKSNLAQIIKENHINVLELDERLETISQKLQIAINDNLAEYGLFMPEFFVSTIITPNDDPNFIRLKQQHADMYLNVREEQVRKAEAEAAFERRAVEVQTDARMKVIGAQGDAEVTRIKADAQAEAYRLQAQAEAQEMQMKGYTYAQETARQVGIEAVKGDGAGMATIGGAMGDIMGLGVQLGAMGSVMGMTKEAIAPITEVMKPTSTQTESWHCTCGASASGLFCNQCGAKKPAPIQAWDCSCGEKGIQGKFCGSCGSAKPEPVATWDCACGEKHIQGKFCGNCGSPKPASTWDCSCGNKGISAKFCGNCGAKQEGK